MDHRIVLLGLLVLALPAWAAASAWVEVKGGSWKPSIEQLSDVESALRGQIPPASRNRGTIPEWHSYTFQYQGQTTLLRHRYVRVNAFCDSRGNYPNITADWVLVMDGGACFFSAKFDVEEKRLYDIAVNGVA
jgi:hypothetical protein